MASPWPAKPHGDIVLSWRMLPKILKKKKMARSRSRKKMRSSKLEMEIQGFLGQDTRFQN